MPTVEALTEKCLPCPTAIFHKIKCRRNVKILDNKAGCGYKGTADVGNPHVDPYQQPTPGVDKWGQIEWSYTPSVAPSTSEIYTTRNTTSGNSSSPRLRSGAGLSLGPGGMMTPGTIKTPEPETAEQLLFDVTVVLYDRVDPHGMTSWIKNDTLSKFMKLYVVQCIDPALSKRMANGAFSEMIKDGRVKHKALEAKNITLNTQANLTEFDPIVDPVTGRKIYRIEYTFTFALRSPKIGHVSYFAGCFFDGLEVMAEYGLDSCTVIDSMVCKTSYINVYHNGVLNSKDKRVRCGKSSLSFVPPTADEKNPDETVEEDLHCKLPYFSSLCLSRDCKNNCKFIFGADYRRIIREKSPYGYLVLSPWVDIVNGLLKCTTILDLTIFRIDPKQLANGETVSNILCEGESIKLIPGLGMSVGTTESTTSHYVVSNQRKQFPIRGVYSTPLITALEPFTPSRTGAEETESLLGTLQEVVLYYASDAAIPLAYRHFSVADYEIALSKGKGEYQYGLTMQIEDNIHKCLLRKLKQLRKMLSVIKEYYQEATKPCNYNGRTNSFFKHFIEFVLTGDGPNRWRDAIAAYVDIAKTFFFKEYPTIVEIRELIEDLLYKLNPHTASPDSILEVIKLFSDALDVLYRHVKSDVTDRSSYFDGAGPFTRFGGSGFGSSATPGSHPGLTSGIVRKKNLIELDHLFKERFVADIFNNTGLDYLGCDPDQEDNPPSMEVDDLPDFLQAPVTT